VLFTLPLSPQRIDQFVWCRCLFSSMSSSALGPFCQSSMWPPSLCSVLATSIATRCNYASNVLIGAIRFVAILSSISHQPAASTSTDRTPFPSLSFSAQWSHSPSKQTAVVQERASVIQPARTMLIERCSFAHLLMKTFAWWFAWFFFISFSLSFFRCPLAL